MLMILLIPIHPQPRLLMTMLPLLELSILELPIRTI